MKKIIILVLIAFVTLMLSVSAFAVGPGKTLEYDGKGAGKVTFDGKVHAGKGLKCNDCHPAIFKMKKGSTVGAMKDMNAGKSCGTCHNGTKASDVKDNANCGKCHKK